MNESAETALSRAFDHGNEHNDAAFFDRVARYWVDALRGGGIVFPRSRA